MSTPIAYVRKSRKVRAGQAVASAGDQHAAILTYLPANELPPLVNLPGMSAEYPGAFMDNESASKDDRADRPGWQATLAALRSGAADTLIVHAIDRASRMGLRHLLHELPPNVRLIAILDAYDSARDDIGAEVMLTVKAREARDYITKLSARVMDSKARQRTAGEYSGQPPYGYTRSRDAHGKPYGLLIHDPDRWPVVLQIFTWTAEGVSMRRIADRLNRTDHRTTRGGLWAFNHVRHVLTNEVYAGWLTRRNKSTGFVSERVLDAHGRPVWALADGVNPVPPELVQRARDAMTGRPGFTGVKTNVGNRLMSKVATCDGCGGPMSWNGHAYWRCSRNGTQPGGCPNPGTVRDAELAPLVVSRTLAALCGLDPADPDDAVALAQVAAAWFGETHTADAAELAEARRAVEDVKRRAARLRTLFLGGLYEDARDEYERENAAIRRDREAAAKRLGELESAATIDVAWMTEPETLHPAWDGADLVTRRAILAAALAEVRVTGTPTTDPRPTDERMRIRLRWETPA